MTMLNIWKYCLKPLLTLTLPWGPKGRKLRIEYLMEQTNESRDVCAALVYYRDVERFGVDSLTDDERTDARRIKNLVEKGSIVLPADRKGT